MFSWVIEHTCLMVVRTERRLRLPRDRGENAKHENTKPACHDGHNCQSGRRQTPKRNARQHDGGRQRGAFQPRYDRSIGSECRLPESLAMARLGLLLMHGWFLPDGNLRTPPSQRTSMVPIRMTPAIGHIF